MVRCAITALQAYGEDPALARRRLLERAEAWVVDGIELIQLREKHLAGGDLLSLARHLVRLAAASHTRVLINSRTDVAVASGAHGVHLTTDPEALRPAQVRSIFAAAGRPRPLVSLSCHNAAEVGKAVEAGVDLVLFGPVYEKQVGPVRVQPGAGVAALQQAVSRAGDVPVLALGGITPSRFAEVLGAGAAGVAGIRLFK